MNRKNILILTQTGDTHAYAVAEALRLKGAEPILWHTSDFPTRATESVRFENQRGSVRIQGPDLDLTDLRPEVVWNRRPAFVLDEDILHPADRKFARSEIHVFRRSLFDTLFPQARWVNPQAAATRASHKLYQHHAAVRLGLEMPATLYSNDPDEIRRFLRAHVLRATADEMAARYAESHVVVPDQNWYEGETGGEPKRPASGEDPPREEGAALAAGTPAETLSAS